MGLLLDIIVWASGEVRRACCGCSNAASMSLSCTGCACFLLRQPMPVVILGRALTWCMRLVPRFLPSTTRGGGVDNFLNGTDYTPGGYGLGTLLSCLQEDNPPVHKAVMCTLRPEPLCLTEYAFAYDYPLRRRKALVHYY